MVDKSFSFDFNLKLRSLLSNIKIRMKYFVFECVYTESMCKTVLMLEKVRNKALKDNVIESYLVANEAICQVKCMQHDFCVSYNFGPHQKNQYICEISSSDHIRSPQQMELRKGFIYQGTKVIIHFSSICSQSAVLVGCVYKDQRQV